MIKYNEGVKNDISRAKIPKNTNLTEHFFAA